MKKILSYFILGYLLLTGCTSTAKLAYLDNLPKTSETSYFPFSIPDYKVQYRDILYIEAKFQNSEGRIEDILQGNASINAAYVGAESSQMLMGYNVDKEGYIYLPVIGKISVGEKTLPEIKQVVQHKVDSVFKHTFVDVKLLSFKYTVLGEVKAPGTYINYNNFLTILEALGRAGGISDLGNRNRILVVRPQDNGTKTYRINVNDKNLLTSEAYFLMPNDVVIVESVRQKIFYQNLPAISFIITSLTSTVTMTLLLINYFK